MANERYNSWLIDEGESRQIVAVSVPRMLFTGTVLTLVGLVVVWALFLLVATL